MNDAQRFREQIETTAEVFETQLTELRSIIEAKESELSDLRSLQYEIESKLRTAGLRAAQARRGRVLQASEMHGPLALVKDGRK